MFFRKSLHDVRRWWGGVPAEFLLFFFVLCREQTPTTHGSIYMPDRSARAAEHSGKKKKKKTGCGAGMGPPRPVEKGKSLAKEQQIDPLSLGL